ncbi:MAG: hypothetical protein F6K54_03375 [Okeania sp. SIO3B5]|uniref:hypothetical protein n=1 Tax=Okeania sp. SIO3B5 TaxID=2607811 RepID=UPI0013FF77B6|nr:hypothetical protein [Okeania sp. SIO3B5]NEO52205.1 hypothetical protein [Okeania sp. SIO3B5]
MNKNFELNKGVFQLTFSARLLPFFCGIINKEKLYSRRQKEEGRRKKEEGRRKKEEGRRKKEKSCVVLILGF